MDRRVLSAYQSSRQANNVESSNATMLSIPNALISGGFTNHGMSWSVLCARGFNSLCSSRRCQLDCIWKRWQPLCLYIRNFVIGVYSRLFFNFCNLFVWQIQFAVGQQACTKSVFSLHDWRRTLIWNPCRTTNLHSRTA